MPWIKLPATIMLALWLSCSTVAVLAGPLPLAEQKHLASKGRVTMCVDPDWMPFEEIDSRGRHVGIAADFMQQFSKILATPIELVATESWSQSVEYAKARKCDILSLLNESPERKQYLSFTDPYVSSAVVLVARNDVVYLDGLASMSGKTLGIVEGYVYEELIRRDFPDIEIVHVQSMGDALKKVADGEIYATMDPLFIILRQIQELGLSNLKIAGHTEYKNEFRVGVRKDDPLLLSAFQHAVLELRPELKNQILQRWYTVRLEHGVDYRLFWQVLVIVMVIFGVLIYRNRDIRKFNLKLEEKNRELERLSSTDFLTGIANRVRLDQELQREMERFNRYQRPFTVILFDIDYFKRVNDRFGHQGGDRVLVEISNLVVQLLRRNDIFGRWGGEEFLIICPETRERGGFEIAEKLRMAISEHDFPLPLQVTASFGVLEYQLNQPMDQLLSWVDHRLYAAKDAGRNRVVDSTADGPAYAG
ncbi:MAG: diguanylate cyclase [Motiliproteus sp.]|nr:diguanylate cyclase [Motiliproteus sp.]MCW9052112.1 diguanylate cyclase [Motiliproteus sp.]